MMTRQQMRHIKRTVPGNDVQAVHAAIVQTEVLNSLLWVGQYLRRIEDAEDEAQIEGDTERAKALRSIHREYAAAERELMQLWIQEAAR